MTQAIDRLGNPFTARFSGQATFSKLRCRECGTEYKAEARHVCEECFGPLEVTYDYDVIKSTVSREIIEAGPNSIWRYRPFLPATAQRSRC